MIKCIKFLFHISTCGIFWFLILYIKNKKAKSEERKFSRQAETEELERMREVEAREKIRLRKANSKKNIRLREALEKRYEAQAAERLAKAREAKAAREYDKFVEKLTKIPGITKKMAEYIIEEFNTQQNLKKATIENMLTVPKLSKRQAEAIKKKFS